MRRGRFEGVVAGAAAVAAAAALAGVGVAGADTLAVDHGVWGFDRNGSCYSTNPSTSDCSGGVRGDVAIVTGDTVTWHINPPNTNTAHNVGGANDVPADPTWNAYSSEFVSNGQITKTFYKPGVYEYLCEAHPSMVGTITVTGDPIETPTPTPTVTATATATPTVTATPTPTPTTQPGGGDDHTSTPPPPRLTDTVKPALRQLKAKALRRGARVTFTLSEKATVTLRVKRGRKVLETVRLQARAGRRTVTVRRLKKGRYTIELLARDAAGNRSLAVKKSVRIKR